MEREAFAAALDAYVEARGKNIHDIDASVRVGEMIAAAINADTRWFWHGRDA